MNHCKVPHYNALSTPKERAAYIPTTQSAPALLSCYLHPSTPSPAASPSRITSSNTTNPCFITATSNPTNDATTTVAEATATEALHDRLSRLTGEHIADEDWRDFVGEEEMQILRDMAPRSMWSTTQIEYGNLIAFARWRGGGECTVMVMRHSKDDGDFRCQEAAFLCH